MSDGIDREMKELFEELDAASPSPPPMPQAPTSSFAPRWQRLLLPAGAVAALLLVIGIAGQFFLGEEAGVADPAATTAAEGMDDGEQPPATRPSGRALILADLNLACATFVDVSDQALTSSPGTDEEHLSALSDLLPPLVDLRDSVVSADLELEDPVFGPIAEEAADLVASVEVASGGAASEATAAYQEARIAVTGLGDGLSSYGALDCSALAQNLP